MLLRLQAHGSEDEDSGGKDLPTPTLRTMHANTPEIAKDAILGTGQSRPARPFRFSGGLVSIVLDVAAHGAR
jgi:hypothetical protein